VKNAILFVLARSIGLYLKRQIIRNYQTDARGSLSRINNAKSIKTANKLPQFIDFRRKKLLFIRQAGVKVRQKK